MLLVVVFVDFDADDAGECVRVAIILKAKFLVIVAASLVLEHVANERQLVFQIALELDDSLRVVSIRKKNNNKTTMMINTM